MRWVETEIDELFDCSSTAVFFGHYITKLFSSRDVSRVATKYTNIFTGEEEIYPRHGRDIIVLYFIVPILQICPINTCVRDKYFRYALRILQTRNACTCLKRCGSLKFVWHFIHVIMRHGIRSFHFKRTNYLLFVNIRSISRLVFSSPALIFTKSAVVATTLKGSHQRDVFNSWGGVHTGCFFWLFRPKND